MIDFRYAMWAFAAGTLIPAMAILNARLGRILGEPAHAAVVLFAVGLFAASAANVALTRRFPSLVALSASSPINFAGGAIVAFYVLSVTMLAPRFGIGNVILFAMTAQILTAALIDHFGLFGAPVRRLTTGRFLGIAILFAGLAISQLATTNPNEPEI